MNNRINVVNDTSGDNSYRGDIDGLRAVAVLLIIFYHAFPNTLPGGFIGVDIFFVISGYLISTIIFANLKKANFSFLDFYTRRVNRIFPALIVVLVTCFTFGWFTLLADEFKFLGKHIASGAGFISNLVFWQESGYFDTSSHSKPLLHLWSLGIEEQFYILWPILMWLSWKHKLNLFNVSILIFLVSFGLNIYQIYFLGELSSSFFLPHSRFWELMAGAILAQGKELLNHNNSLNSIKSIQSNIGFGLIFTAALLIDKTNSFPGFWALFPVVGTVLIINAGENSWLNRKILFSPPLVWIGLISYSLYLWHWPLIVFARILNHELQTPLIQISALIGSFLLATLSFNFIEKPFRFGGYKKAKATILCFTMLIVGYIGFNTYVRDGLTFRLNQIQFRLPPVLQSLGEKQSIPTNQNNELNKDRISESNGLSPDASNHTLVNYKKPQIWLWGDSYAGHLVAGYQSRFGNAFEIVRFNVNGCPPILGLELTNRINCLKGNQEVLDRIVSERPFKVVLAANWTDYDWKQIESTLNAFQKANYNQIDIIGPAPQWNDSLYKQLYLNYLKTKNSNIPYRMQFGLNPNFLEIEPKLMALAQRYQARYISIVNILCDRSGCITRFGDTADTLASFDGGHFTEMASRFVVDQFPQLSLEKSSKN